MASNAASSVQFRVNGTETAQDGHAELNARGALELGTIGLFLRLRPVVSNGSVFVAWQHGATFL